MSIIHGSNVSVVPPSIKIKYISSHGDGGGGCALAAFHGYFIKFKHRPTYLLVIKHDFMNSRVAAESPHGGPPQTRGYTLLPPRRTWRQKKRFSALGAPLGQNLPLFAARYEMMAHQWDKCIICWLSVRRRGAKQPPTRPRGKPAKQRGGEGWLKQAFILFIYLFFF